MPLHGWRSTAAQLPSCDDARMASEAASLVLERHIAAHGC